MRYLIIIAIAFVLFIPSNVFADIIQEKFILLFPDLNNAYKVMDEKFKQTSAGFGTHRFFDDEYANFSHLNVEDKSGYKYPGLGAVGIYKMKTNQDASKIFGSDYDGNNTLLNTVNSNSKLKCKTDSTLGYFAKYLCKHENILISIQEDYDDNGGDLLLESVYQNYVRLIISQPKTTYYDTFLSLQVQDSLSQGYIKVKPTLTYSSGNALTTNNISIYVDGKYSTKVTSNQWSSNIYAGSGAYHTIKASIAEMTSTIDDSIKYRSSSNTMNYFVKAASTPTPTPTPTLTQKSSSSGTSSESFPTEYVITGIVIVVIAVSIGITLSKRNKTVPVMAAQPAKVQTVSDETQFWVCPNCGGDTQYRNGKQFCPSCNMYL